MKTKTWFGLGIWLLLFIAANCHAQEAGTGAWTRFRGTDGMGMESRVDKQGNWDASQYQWDIALPGVGHSSPVVWGSTIFVTSADDGQDLGHVMAVDELEGKILWQKEFEVGDLTMHVDNNQASVTPAVDECDLVYPGKNTPDGTFSSGGTSVGFGIRGD